MSRVVIDNLQDLINAINAAPQMKGQLRHMLHATAKQVSACLNKRPKQIGIDDLVAIRPRLKVYLQERRFKPNAVRAYRNYARMLVEIAGHFGWVRRKVR